MKRCPALTLQEALLGATPRAKACLNDLLKDDLEGLDDAAGANLRRLQRRLTDEYSAFRIGTIVVGILRAGDVTAIRAWAARVAPTFRISGSDDAPLHDLHGSAYLALSHYVAAWNRQKIRVA